MTNRNAVYGSALAILSGCSLMNKYDREWPDSDELANGGAQGSGRSPTAGAAGSTFAPLGGSTTVTGEETGGRTTPGGGRTTGGSSNEGASPGTTLGGVAGSTSVSVGGASPGGMSADGAGTSGAPGSLQGGAPAFGGNTNAGGGYQGGSSIGGASIGGVTSGGTASGGKASGGTTPASVGGAANAGAAQGGAASGGSCSSGTMCAGTCVSLATDKNNCGTCGHSCRYASSSCIDGKCQPVVLASGQSTPTKMAQDATYVYWLDSGNYWIKRTAKDGSIDRTTPENVASTGSQVDFTVVGNLLEWTNNREPNDLPTEIRHLVLSPFGAPTPNAYFIGGWLNGMIGSATHTFFTVTTGGQVSVMSKTPGSSATTTLCGPPTVCGAITDLAIDSNNLYWGDIGSGPYGGSIWKMSVSGGPIAKLATAYYSEHVASDGENVYFESVPGGEPSALMRVGVDGATGPVVAATGTVGGIATDSSGVYWADEDSCINSLRRGTSVVSTVAVGQGAPLYVITDATSIFWTNSTSGTVMAVAK